MTHYEILSHRLLNQQIISTKFTKPEEIVRWMVAMQSQEYAMAKWAIGLRLPGFNDADIEQVFNEGKILRTHLMRPTWHFVAPEDIRWLLALTAPRVSAINNYQYKKEGLDASVFKKCNEVIVKSLEGGKFLIRNDIKAELSKNGIEADGVRLTGIMMQAELEGLICSGPRSGKQFTYALLEERVPAVPPMTREEALHQFLNRYFVTRGPATIHDFCYWSGLSLTEARAGLPELSKDFERRQIDGLEYIFLPQDISVVPKTLPTFLMPDYDEYGMSYKNKEAITDSEISKKQISEISSSYHMIISEGKLAGTWQKVKKGKSLEVETSPYTPLIKRKEASLKKAVLKFKAFSQNTTD